MNYKKTVCALLISFILSTLVLTTSAFAATEDKKIERVYSYLGAGSDDTVQAKPEKPGKPSPIATVNIRNIPSGDTLYGTVLIIAQVTGIFDHVVYQVGKAAEMPMDQVDSSERYEASWTTTTDDIGSSTLVVKAKDSNDEDVASSSVSVQIVGAPVYTLRYETDCMTGQTPDAGVIEYLTNYWLGHAIVVQFDIDDQNILDPTPSDGYITEADFLALEKTYNEGPTNSKLEGGYQYTLPDKWMLYGTYADNPVDPHVGGFTYVVRIGRDYVAGNYIFIANEMIESWESENNIPVKGGEVIVTGHETGHSIGIVVGAGGEKYDTDYYSIMSYMRLENAKDMKDYWYYSKEYWSTRNLGYYD